jgi:hypothetical protein
MRKMPVARLDKPVRLPTDLYFIQTDCPEGHIKIGIASDVARRMGKMQMDCPYGLKLLKIVKDAAHMEIQLHQQFASSRIRGEWFRKSPELMKVIDDLPGWEAPASLGIEGVPLIDVEEDPTYDRIHNLAMELWREREARFPERVRRSQPDQTDFISGAWGLMFAEAKQIIERRSAALAELGKPDGELLEAGGE